VVSSEGALGSRAAREGVPFADEYLEAFRRIDAHSVAISYEVEQTELLLILLDLRKHRLTDPESLGDGGLVQAFSAPGSNESRKQALVFRREFVSACHTPPLWPPP
jgi:hypothetical protein